MLINHDDNFLRLPSVATATLPGSCVFSPHTGGVATLNPRLTAGKPSGLLLGVHETISPFRNAGALPDAFPIYALIN